MSLLRLRLPLRSSALRAAPHRSLPTSSTFGATPSIKNLMPARHATGDYGSGTGSPVGENPQSQPTNPKSELEHPGPAAPDVGQGKSESESGSGQGAGESAKGSGGGGKKGGDGEDKTQGAQPKILSENPPPASEQAQEVKQHNADMEQRAERANEKLGDADEDKDKVSKSFWSGHGGADRQP